MRGTDAAPWSPADAQALLDALMARSSPYGVVFIDPEGQIKGTNGGADMLLGYQAGELIGKPIALLFTHEDIERQLPAHELNTARAFGTAEDERWHVRKDGSLFWASGMTLAMGAADQARGYSKIFRNATPLKLRMDALDKELQQMRQQRKDRDAFFATIAHELRNPLQPMATATALLTHPSEAMRHAQALKILERQLGFMERLVEDLIDLSRVAESKLHISYETIELQRLVQDAVNSCRGQAAARPVALTCVVPPAPIHVEVDAARMTQVIVNLVTNAIKFTPGGGKVAVWASADEAQFIVKVQDTGRGIPPHLQHRIFDLFTQADGSDTGRGKGLGLGLALVKDIVSLHRGTVEVRSEGAGKGSEFFIHVPLARPSDR